MSNMFRPFFEFLFLFFFQNICYEALLIDTKEKEKYI